MHAPTNLCCSVWFWQWWWFSGESCSSCCPPWRLLPPLPVSILFLWHARSCGSACGSSRAWAGPGHPPPATPSRWTLIHTLPQSARSPPPHSPVEERTHADIKAFALSQRKMAHVQKCTPSERKKKKEKENRNVQAHTGSMQDNGQWSNITEAKVISVFCKIQCYRAITLIRESQGRNYT